MQGFSGIFLLISDSRGGMVKEDENRVLRSGELSTLAQLSISV